MTKMIFLQRKIRQKDVGIRLLIVLEVINKFDLLTLFKFPNW